MTRDFRCTAVLVAAAGVETSLLVLVPDACRSLLPGAAAGPATAPAQRFGDVLGGVLLLVTAVAWTHWCLVLVAALTRQRVRLAPAGWRLAAAGCLGLAVTVAATGAAVPVEGGGGVARLDGLPLPDRPVGSGVTCGARACGGWIVTVRPGDTLWALAAARLPTGADDVRVDRAWHTWYSANRRVVGPDPNLLLPGQRLRVPVDHRAGYERTPR